jgi:hypothetical protein
MKKIIKPILYPILFLSKIYLSAKYFIYRDMPDHLVNRVDKRKNVYTLLWDRSALSSAEYIEKHLNNAMVFEKKEGLWKYAITKIQYGGILAEFGVFSGTSINFFSSRINQNQNIYGFDSFEGLSNDWYGTQLPSGSFDLNGKIPAVNNNVHLIKGWFENTIPTFLKEKKGHFSFIHFDADTYAATEMILACINNRIKPNTIILFDEYHGFPNWENGEFLAWKNYVQLNSTKYEYLGFSKNQALIRVI